MGKPKRVKKLSGSKNEKQVSKPDPKNNEKVIWVFDNIDRDGKFAFDLNQIEKDKNLKKIFNFLLSYSTMTWQDVFKQTHDDGRSKHHNLLNGDDRLSNEAQERIDFKRKDQDIEGLFSFALENKLRIIGFREKEFFRVTWYDPNHEFYISKKKHT